MSPATERYLAILHSVCGRLSSRTRRVARPAGSPPVPEQPRCFGEGSHSFGPLDALDAFDNAHRVLRNRLTRLEGAVSVACTLPARRDSGPRSGLFDALEPVNGEFTGFAARPALLEGTALRAQSLARSPRLVSSWSAAVRVRAARGHRVRKAVPRA